MNALFLDDERFPPQDGRQWVILRSVQSAKDYIMKHGLPDHVSFDNDLGQDMPEGYLLADWLIEQDLDRGGDLIGQDFTFYVQVLEWIAFDFKVVVVVSKVAQIQIYGHHFEV